MKTAWLISLIILVSMTASACQAISPSGESEEYPGPGVTYPASSQQFPAYPAAENSSSSAPAVLYPDASDGDYMEWYQVTALITNGEVEKVVQTHDLQIYITLKDGRTLVSVQPEIDDVIKFIKKCGDACKDIRIATE